MKKEGEGCGDGCSSCLELLTLDPENMARVVPGRIMNVRFSPCDDSRLQQVWGGWILES